MEIADRIEKHVLLKAPVSRVWQAIAKAKEFGKWFGIKLDGDFVEGKAMTGSFEAEFDENAIIAYQKSLGLEPSRVKTPAANSVFCTVVRIEPEKYFSFRWIPYGIDAEAQLESEPTTLVEFKLEPDGDYTRLAIIESGFDAVPLHRRQRAFLMNEDGWTEQAENIASHVENS